MRIMLYILSIIVFSCILTFIGVVPVEIELREKEANEKLMEQLRVSSIPDEYKCYSENGVQFNIYTGKMCSDSYVRFMRDCMNLLHDVDECYYMAENVKGHTSRY